MKFIITLLIFLVVGMFGLLLEESKKGAKIKETHDCVREVTDYIVTYMYVGSGPIPLFTPYQRCVEYKKKGPVETPSRSI